MYNSVKDLAMLSKINNRLRQIKYFYGLNPMFNPGRRGKFKGNRYSHFKK